MTPAEAQRHLTLIHSCGCQEYWFMDPPVAMRCDLHQTAPGPTDSAVAPEHLEQALAVLAAADAVEIERRRSENTPKETG